MKTQPKPEVLQGVLANLPPLPAVIRYYDDFSDSYDQVTEPDQSYRWRIHFDGRSRILDFIDFDPPVRKVVRCWCAFVLADLSPVTAYKYLDGLRTVPIERTMGLVTCSPQDIRSHWKELHGCNLLYGAFAPLSSFLAFLCRFSIGAWRPQWLDLVSQLPYPKIDKYASVRVGDAFLTRLEETAIIRHIDDTCVRIQEEPRSISDDLVETTAILVCSYQFGLRSKQIAMLEMRNIRIWNDGLEDRPAVHLTFTMIKQRSPKQVFPMVRRVKREWSPLFAELLQRAQHEGLAGMDHVYHRTPAECGKVIGDLTESVGQRRRTTTELRHTAAQRLVDAGASEEELASFMGHSDLDTGLIYFQSTPTQAERVNKALGISATYQCVAKIAHNRFITPEDLVELKGDQQIGGVPHGIPISGIGGCSRGQPSCPFNPVMSCYGCTRFMPVADVTVHQNVLADLRGILKLFYAASRAERGSPAFQLERTITNVQAVIDELGGDRHELTS